MLTLLAAFLDKGPTLTTNATHKNAIVPVKIDKMEVERILTEMRDLLYSTYDN